MIALDQAVGSVQAEFALYAYARRKLQFERSAICWEGRCELSPTFPAVVILPVTLDDCLQRLQSTRETFLLKVVLSYMNDEDLLKVKKSASKRPYLGTVIMAQNRAGREIPNVASVHHGKLPVGEDGIHYNAEGQIKLGKITASAVGEFYKAKE